MMGIASLNPSYGLIRLELKRWTVPIANVGSTPTKFFQQRLRSFIGEIASYGNVLSAFIFAPHCPLVTDSSQILLPDDLIQDPVNVPFPLG